MGTIKNKIQKFVNMFGYQIPRKPQPPRWYQNLHNEYSKKLETLGIYKAHYGCGPILFGDGWVNIDLMHAPKDTTKVYLVVDLVAKHPFPSNFFKYSFCEDLIEHFNQEKAIKFLTETFRILRPLGVLRMSAPCLSGALRRHYRSSDYEGACVMQYEAYTMYEHKHFFSEESLSIVAQHIGFSNIIWVEYGKSNYEELCNLE